MPNLFEWKQEKVENFREQLKDQVREGFDVETHFLFTAEQIAEIKEEIEIEDFEEIVEDFEELSLDEDELEETGFVHEAYEFVPNENGSSMDIEIEIDTSLVEVSEETLEKLCALFFAEEADVEYIEESGGVARAKIIFRRSKGEVVKRKKCTKGMRLVGNRCLPQTGTQKSKERRRGIKLKRAFKAMGAGKKKKAKIKAKITTRRIRGRARNLANTVN